MINSKNYELNGLSLQYLINNCKFLVGSLWDITDKDADRMVK